MPLKNITAFFFIAVLGLFIPQIVHAQISDSLPVLIRKMQRGENDSIRTNAAMEFQKRFEDSLNVSGSFDNPFSDFKNVSIAKDVENRFKIYSWTFPNFDGSRYRYSGYVQVKQEKTDSIITFILSDSTAIIQKPESEKLKSERWYGAAYYAVNKVKYKGKNYFVLLGWKGFNQQITKKVIEVCYIEKGELKFGYPLLKSGSVYKNRMIYSFNSQASMSLRFENNGKKIVLDHISTPRSKSADVDLASQAGPDGTYDSFNLKKGRYVLDKDVDARSETAPVKELPTPTEKQ
ncbi:MAG: hypothetical protein ACO1G9_10475 [Bacteroidota bacterium]